MLEPGIVLVSLFSYCRLVRTTDNAKLAYLFDLLVHVLEELGR